MNQRTEFLIALAAVLFALCAAIYTNGLVGKKTEPNFTVRNVEMYDQNNGLFPVCEGPRPCVAMSQLWVDQRNRVAVSCDAGVDCSEEVHDWLAKNCPDCVCVGFACEGKKAK